MLEVLSKVNDTISSHLKATLKEHGIENHENDLVRKEADRVPIKIFYDGKEMLRIEKLVMNKDSWEITMIKYLPNEEKKVIIQV